ncbi:hypothetical protein [Streptomyces sp. MNU77]|uniref:hypothetical protein n=1 Tax=Streptomyces sp. MNU77 TaxID=1573406 RepID=UPI0021170073|nr:hypothetical protein [Streptomyces sp. MNU77]
MTSTQVRETHRAPLPQALTGTCPDCQLIMEACTCTGVSQLLTALTPRAGVADEIGRQDDRGGHDGRGYERDETDQFNRLVQQLVDDGDEHAAVAGRRARRTLQEMIPGYVRQPVLNLLSPPTMGQCPLCERWNCPGHDCPPGVTTTRPECKDLSDQQDREDLSKKVGEANKRSESRPK